MFNIENKTCKVCKIKIPMPRKRDLIKEFCGRKCVAIAYKRNASVECIYCSLKFHPTIAREKFCSKSCSNKHKEKFHLRYCKRCNKSFRLLNIAWETRGDGLFCSGSCATRKLNVDEEFFNDIDTEEKAYWLGFLFADGYQNGQEMIVNLSVKDVLHLEKLRTALKK